jgi:hypothetical protein
MIFTSLEMFAKQFGDEGSVVHEYNKPESAQVEDMTASPDVLMKLVEFSERVHCADVQRAGDDVPGDIQACAGMLSPRRLEVNDKAMLGRVWYVSR